VVNESSNDKLEFLRRKEKIVLIRSIALSGWLLQLSICSVEHFALMFVVGSKGGHGYEGAGIDSEGFLCFSFGPGAGSKNL